MKVFPLMTNNYAFVCMHAWVSLYSTWHSTRQLNGFRQRQSSCTQEVTHLGCAVISSWVPRWRQWWMTSHLSFTCISFEDPLRSRDIELYRTAQIKVIHVIAGIMSCNSVLDKRLPSSLKWWCLDPVLLGFLSLHIKLKNCGTSMNGKHISQLVQNYYQNTEL